MLRQAFSPNAEGTTGAGDSQPAPEDVKSPAGADAGSSASVEAVKPRAPTLDRDNPWPGLGSYDESARLYFNGRGEKIGELHAACSMNR